MPDINEARLRTAVAQISGRDVSAVQTDDDLVNALDLDSLEALRVLAGLEKRFGVRFAENQLSQLRNFRALLAALNEPQIQGEEQS